MKFVVVNGPLHEVDVKLHWESKQKIKKIVGWTSVVAASVAGAYLYSKKLDTK